MYVIADRHPENAYVHVEMRIGAGRSPEVRQHAAEHVFKALKSAVSALPCDAPIGLSLEVVEIDPVGSLKANGIHAAVERRALKNARGG
jgi:5-carboxymethyl-2-hydroxymuconate isomerase